MEATFKSGRNLATATVVLLGIIAALMLGEAVGWLVIAQTSRENPTLGMVTAGIVGLMTFTSIACDIAAAVLFSMWVYRATANLPALGSMSCRFTPAGAVWAFYIPFVNLVRGHQVMANIWSESQPRAITDEGYLKPTSIAIVNWWWALWIGCGIIGGIVGAVLVEGSVVAEAQAFFLVPRAIAAVLCLVMVHKADARQREQALDLSRRASVPQPTGMILR